MPQLQVAEDEFIYPIFGQHCQTYISGQLVYIILSMGWVLFSLKPQN